MIGKSSIKLLKPWFCQSNLWLLLYKKVNGTNQKKTWKVHLKAGQFWCQPMEVSWARFDNQADITWIFSKQQVQNRLFKIPLVLLNTFWRSCHDLCSFAPTKMKASTSTPQRFTPCRCQNQLISIFSSTTFIFARESRAKPSFATMACWFGLLDPTNIVYLANLQNISPT